MAREIFSWQVVFLFVALPTIPLSIILMTLKEPLRRGVKKEVEAGEGVSWNETMGYIWLNKKTIVCHSLGFAMLSFSGYGSGAWNPSHFHRNFDLGLAHIGIVTGLINVSAPNVRATISSRTTRKSAGPRQNRTHGRTHGSRWWHVRSG